MTKGRFRGLAALALLPLMLGAAGLGKGEELPNLYELTARSDLVVAARVVAGSLKLAQVEVVEVFRGDAKQGQRLQIAFRDLNSTLGKADRIVFGDMEKDLLFLVPELNYEGRRKGPDRFTLVRGRFGKFTLPREGEDVYLEAVREFARLASLKDHRLLFGELKDLLKSRNPILVDAGLEEVARLQLMDHRMVPVAMHFLQDPSPKRRVGALQLLGGFLGTVKERPASPELQDSVLPPLQAMARNDPQEAVRVAAVEALGKWQGDAPLETLREIAEQDPAQAVRYQAKLELFRRAEEEKPEGRSPSQNP